MFGDRKRSPSPERGDKRLNERPRTGDSSSPSYGNTSAEREKHYLRYLYSVSTRESDQQQQQQVDPRRPAEAPLSSSLQELGKSKEAPSLPDDQPHEFLSPQDHKGILFANIQIVRNSDKGNSMFAGENIEKGGAILSFIGDILPIERASSDLSLQIDENSCIESTVEFDNNINHSCEPNCYIDFSQNAKKPLLVAIRDIKKGEELSFDYNTTDYDLKDSPWEGHFTCNCHATKCIGEIEGYKHLKVEQKREIYPYLAPFLKKKYDEEIRVSSQKFGADPLVNLGQKRHDESSSANLSQDSEMIQEN